MKRSAEFKNRISRTISHVHRDERGMEALQVVLITAVAAVILSIFVRLWPQIQYFLYESMDIIFFTEDG